MMHFLPEFILITMALVFFFLSLGKLPTKTLRRLALSGAYLATAATIVSFNETGVYFFNAYSIEPFSQVFKLVLCSGFAFVIAMSPGLLGVKERLNGEYYFFLFLSMFGLVLLSSAAEFLTLILALEISSFSVYVIIPFRRKGKGYRAQMEATLKYMMFGALNTGLTLYGVSYVYGITHTTYLHELARIVPGMITSEPLLVVGFILIFCGIFFKLAMFPMHFWAPDVYQGAANETSTFVATLPKVGATLMLLRLVSLLDHVPSVLTIIISILAVLSMTLGNLSALVQNDVKRLMAYSSIAHAGYLMVGIAAGNHQGLVAAVYYITAYLFLNIACFYVIYHLAPLGNNVGFLEVKGLHRRSPILAATLAVGAVGLAGLPPTAGFMGKLLVFVAALDQGMVPLVIFAVINAGVSAYFYLKLIRAAYTGESQGNINIKMKLFSKCLGGVLIVIILLLGIFPKFALDLFDLAVSNAIPLFL
ncbi:MAG: NADH-quinone oxidoreductase subunit N [Pseudomonadota bacterium]